MPPYVTNDVNSHVGATLVANFTRDNLNQKLILTNNGSRQKPVLSKAEGPLLLSRLYTY